jgi:hypothetical protein
MSASNAMSRNENAWRRRSAQVFRQVGRPRQVSTVQQHRHHPHAGPGERGAEFDANEVVRIVQAAPALGVGLAEPTGPDQRQHHAALGQVAFERFDEVLTVGQAFQVHEHVARAELAAQPLVDGACVLDRVLAPIADEDARVRRLPAPCPWPAGALRAPSPPRPPRVGSRRF